MTKQISPITQKYKLWDNCFYLCNLILTIAGASPQQVQPIRSHVLHLRDLKPPDCRLSDPRHQQVPQLPVPQLRVKCVWNLYLKPLSTSRSSPQARLEHTQEKNSSWNNNFDNFTDNFDNFLSRFGRGTHCRQRRESCRIWIRCARFSRGLPAVIMSGERIDQSETSIQVTWSALTNQNLNPVTITSCDYWIPTFLKLTIDTMFPQIWSGWTSGEEECAVHPGPKHDQRQDLPRHLVTLTLSWSADNEVVSRYWYMTLVFIGLWRLGFRIASIFSWRLYYKHCSSVPQPWAFSE